jgi:hypothetical protein
MKEDQEFTALRRFLKLKRYEKPPPRYFNDFSSDVIARIRADDLADRSEPLEKIQWESPWMQRVLGLFQTKPVFAGLFGAAICVVLVTGIVLLQQADNNPYMGPMGIADTSQAESGTALPSAFGEAKGPLSASATPSVAPVTYSGSNIFEMLQPRTERVNWTPGPK